MKFNRWLFEHWLDNGLNQVHNIIVAGLFNEVLIIAVELIQHLYSATRSEHT